MTEEQPQQLPDRPLECSECKKPIAVIYTEIVGENTTRTSMCSNCPELYRRLHGSPTTSTILSGQIEKEVGVVCNNCGTSLESVKKGVPLGCTECYEVFGNVSSAEMQAAQKLSSRIAIARKAIPIHIGRAPGESKEINPSLRILALNEALKETLSKEDYEQAAWLRSDKGPD